ncbi:hypothetical protein, partial [Klebsiella pneumoniae]|uniref:hypothetical protein n=1 Tax=Klebsiella pneumoniae TaxID=573 RepID=UPI0025A1A71E
LGWCADVCLPGWRHDGDVGSPRANDVVCGHEGWALTWEAEGGFKMLSAELVGFCFCFKNYFFV